MPGPVFIGVRFLVGVSLLFFCRFVFIIFVSFRLQIRFFAAWFVAVCPLQVWVYAVSVTETLVQKGAFIMSLAMIIIAPFVSWIIFRVKPNRAFGCLFLSRLLVCVTVYLTNGWHVEPSQIYFFIGINDAFVWRYCQRVTVISSLLSICVQLFVVGISGLHGVDDNSTWFENKPRP